MLEIYREPLFSTKRIFTYFTVLSVVAIFSIMLFSNWAYVAPILNFFNAASFAKTKTETIPTVQEEKPSIFKDQLKPIYGNAVGLNIASQNINLNLVAVGVAQDGSLETPKDWQQGGWYKKGARPGEKGAVLINAHYDDNLGRPAAFWALKNIKVSDTVYVVDEYGKKYTYQVTEVVYVDINDPNRLEILQTKGNESTITLITCGGVWLPGVSTYSKRLVVRGVLV